MQIESGNFNLTFPFTFIPSNLETVVLPAFFGGTVVNHISSEETIVESVPCLQLVYFIAVDTERQTEK